MKLKYTKKVAWSILAFAIIAVAMVVSAMVLSNMISIGPKTVGYQVTINKVAIDTVGLPAGSPERPDIETSQFLNTQYDFGVVWKSNGYRGTIVFVFEVTGTTAVDDVSLYFWSDGENRWFEFTLNGFGPSVVGFGPNGGMASDDLEHTIDLMVVYNHPGTYGIDIHVQQEIPN